MLFCVAALPSCGSTEIVYARATTLPEEANGFMRIATEDPIRVNVTGTDTVVERGLAGYLVIHEQDLAQLVRNTAELQRLKSGK